MNHLPSLQPVRISDAPVFHRYFQAYPPRISDLSFGNLAGWAESRHIQWTEHDGHLLISFTDSDGETKFYPPVGPDPVRVMRELRAQCLWTRIDEESAGLLAPFVTAVALENHTDYVYASSQLVGLAGKNYDGKRNFIRRAEKFAPVVVPIGEVSTEDCLAIFDEWKQALPPSATIDQERVALELVLNNRETFGIQGIGVQIDGTLAGYAIGERLNDSTIVEHFEKASGRYTGLYAFILHEFAKSVASSFAFINREEDLGIEGLRKAKESWYPVRLVRKYEISAAQLGGDLIHQSGDASGVCRAGTTFSKNPAVVSGVSE